MNHKRNLWPFGIILAFSLFVAGTAGLVVVACGQKAELVSPDYYEQEIRFQGQLDGLARAQALGTSVSYQTETRQIRIALPEEGTSGKPLGEIHLYRPSSAGLDRHFVLNADANGIQLLDAAPLAKGLWKVRIAWTSAGEAYFVERSLTVK